LNTEVLNYRVLLVFAPLLILTGVIGFVLPSDTGLLSGAPAYNIFHIIAGLCGVAVLLLKSSRAARAFNVAFGAIDLYQALASFAHLFPAEYFRWRPADDVLHVVIGAGLILVGALWGRQPAL
jgi:hypothetical protein